MFPGRWTWNTDLMIWEGPDFNVRSVAHYAPQHDCDDDTFIIHYYRSDTNAWIPIL